VIAGPPATVDINLLDDEVVPEWVEAVLM